MDAIKAGDKPVIERLLQEDPSLVGARAPNGTSAILLAAYYGRADLAQVFIAHGAKLDLYEACAVGDLEQARTLVNENRDAVNAFAADGFFPLGLAAFFGHREIVRLCSRTGRRPRPRREIRSASRHCTGRWHAATWTSPSCCWLMARTRMLGRRAGLCRCTRRRLTGKKPSRVCYWSTGPKADAAADDGKTACDLAVARGQNEMAEWLGKVRNG